MLSLLAKAEYPNAPLDLQLQVGWLTLLFLALLVFWAWTRSESVRRAIFAREDPRMFAVWRIGLAAITFQNFWNLKMHWRMLFTDEGMFTTPEIRGRLGRSSLAGWNEVDGFMDGWGVIKFFWGKYSLLYFDSSPDVVTIYLAALFVVLVLYGIGFRTRVTGLIALVLINSLYNRNSVYLEGHDTVFRCCWFLTLFAQVDGAWSVDNWIRRTRERRLLKSGGHSYDLLHLFDRLGHWLWGGAFALWFCAFVDFRTTEVWAVLGAGVAMSAIVGWVELIRRRKLPAQAVGEPTRFQLVPSWPRYLIYLQLTCIYTATGLYKTGPVWLKGDALYYALNMDHFYRFEVFTQWVSALFATNMFRVMTLVTLFWEKGFALILIGLILRFGLQHKDEPWYRAQDQNLVRKWLGRLGLIGAYAVIYRVVVICLPWCLALQADKNPTPPEPALKVVHIILGVVLPLMIVIWHVLGRWPIKIKKPAKVAALRERWFGPATGDAATHFVIDQAFMRAWLFGRRIWLGLGLIFHGILLGFMNIGMFPVIMMWMYVVFFDAEVYLVIFRFCAKLLRRWKWTAWMAPEACDAALSSDSGVLESATETLERDATGPWWSDPYKLFVGPLRMNRDVAAFDREAGKRGGRIPDAVVLVAIVGLLGMIGLRGLEAKTEADLEATRNIAPEDQAEQREARKVEAKARKERLDLLAKTGWWWSFAVLGVGAAFHFRKRRNFDLLPDDRDDRDGSDGKGDGVDSKGDEADSDTALPSGPAAPVMIGGTLLRTFVLGFMVWHVSAVVVTFIPRYSVSKAWRSEAAKPFGSWVRAMNVSQSWKMFAPNPPRSNTFMRTVVVDLDDETYQIGTDHYTERPYVFWYNDRTRKMHRRMVGKSKWYLKYWAQYHCRDWAFEHDGQMPSEVQVLKLKTPIPKPDKLDGPSDPRKRKLRRTEVETHACKPADVAHFMKERRGWPLTEADERAIESEARKAERDAESKRRSWAKRENFGGTPRKKGGDVEVTDPVDKSTKGPRTKPRPRTKAELRKARQ